MTVIIDYHVNLAEFFVLRERGLHFCSMAVSSESCDVVDGYVFKLRFGYLTMCSHKFGEMIKAHSNSFILLET